MVRIKTIPFNEQALTAAKGITQAIQYPSVYILSGKNEAYVGETINIAHRLQQHIRNADRRRLDQLRVIMDKQFNKSATTDIEASLIKYLSADGQFRLQNGNAGIRDYNYYQKDRYKEKFEEIWRMLIKQGIAQHNQIQIENSDLFKFSPYKSLTDDQYKTAESLFDSLLQHLRKSEEAVFLVHGGAGTGKTVLAVYLMKLMSDIMAEHNEMEEEIEEAEDVEKAQGNMMGVGIGVVLILALIGILNYVNTMTGNIQSRQTELAILESVGMTEKQMRRMLIIEGLLFAGISLFLTATIGTAVTYYLYQSMNYRGVPFMIPVFPVFIMAVIVVVVCVAVPLIVERLIGKKKSVVERIRAVE